MKRAHNTNNDPRKKQKKGEEWTPQGPIKKPARTRPPMSKHWVLTLNNPTSEESIIRLNPVMTYIVVGKEKGEELTPHLQGYVVFKNRMRRQQVSAIFPRAWLAIKSTRSTPLEASDYCKKDGHFVEFGVLPKTPAEASKESMTGRWEEAFALAKAGKLEEIEKALLIKHYHAFKRILQDYPPRLKSLDRTCGVWIHGPTGIGKSRKAREDYPDYYDKPINKWWDGYRDQPTILLDDVDKSHGQWLGTFLKRWTDHYPFPAEQKGTTVQIRPQNIVVTSQYTIHDVFAEQDNELIEALCRRFKVITMTDDDPPRTLITGQSNEPDHMDVSSQSSSEEDPRPDTITPELTLSEEEEESNKIEDEFERRNKRIVDLTKLLEM